MPRTSPATLPTTERESLEAWLDYHRATLLMKCEGLTADQLASASVPPSELTLGGLVRHLIGVEDWFHCFDGDEPIDEPDDATIGPEQLFAAHDAAVERSRHAVAGRSLDDALDMEHWVADGVPKEVRPTSLRWVFAHMIEEYARHNGHADLLRERIDGVVGD